MLSEENGLAWRSGAIPLGTADLRAGADTALVELVRSLEAGDEWPTAFASYRRAATRTERAPIPPADGRLNWTWLTDLTDASVALDLGSPFGEVASNLALDFPEVGYVGAATLHGEAARLHLSAAGHRVLLGGTATPTGEALAGRVDLAAFVASPGWARRMPDGVATGEDVVAFAARVLRPSGWLGVVMDNPFWHTGLRTRGWRPGSVRFLRAIHRALRRHRFVETREYVVNYNLDVPSVYVPLTRRAVAQYQVSTHAPSAHRLAARFGLAATLFPARLLLARR